MTHIPIVPDVYRRRKRVKLNTLWARQCARAQISHTYKRDELILELIRFYDEMMEKALQHKNFREIVKELEIY